MPDVDIPLPFDAYVGDEPFVFVSYAHKDGSRVFPELRALHDQGVRVWYDEGIDPGNEWPDEIARALERCAAFIVFVSPTAVASRNVRNEVNEALNLDKPFLAVHLDDTNLPAGLRLRMSSIQAIMKWRMTPERYAKKLIGSLPHRVIASPPAPAVDTGVAAAGAAPPAPDQSAVVVSAIVPQPARETIVHLDAQTAMEFVRIEPGTLLMGSENGSHDERPAHRVTLSQGFELGKFPVTQAQWLTVMGNNPSHFSAGGGQCPVEQVSWDDAQAFIAKLNARRDGITYRLPTEAEWEFACRAGTTGDYGGTGLVEEMGWYEGNSGGQTHPVGQKLPNAWGLYDMHGNVWEWVADWHGPYSSNAVSDPTGPSSGGFRGLRGGSWRHAAGHCRSSYRDWRFPVNRYSSRGFRVCLSRGPASLARSAQ